MNHVGLFWAVIGQAQEEHCPLEVMSPTSDLVFVLSLARSRIPGIIDHMNERIMIIIMCYL
jgi:hypothetical protein